MSLQLKDMLAAYVALSRVRKADCLLLLRAFSPSLFQQGPPPGPHCLMKLLRARCAPTEGMTYTEDDAKAEFDELVRRRECEREKRANREKVWRCFDCEHEFPPEGFDAAEHQVDDVLVKCASKGHWLA